MITFDEIEARVLGAPTRAAAGGVRVIGVDGRSGSGKSTTGRRIAEALGATLVQFDDFLPGWDAMEPGPELIIEWVLDPLSRGEDGRYRLMNWDTLRYEGERDVAWDPLLVIEGVGATCRDLRPYLTLGLWMNTPLDVCEARVRAREDWPSYAPFRAQCVDHENDYIDRENPASSADIIVEGQPPASHDARAGLVVASPRRMRA